MNKINWDIVWSVLRTLLVAGGPVATLLIALDFPPVLVGQWMAAGLAAVAIASVLVPGVEQALNRTNAAKIEAVVALPTELKAEVVAQMPDKVVVEAAAALPDVVQIAVKDDAKNGLQEMIKDDHQPKVVPASAA